MTLLPLTGRAGSGIIDEMKLGVLNHDVPIGGDHRKSCIDVNDEFPFIPPGFVRWF